MILTLSLLKVKVKFAMLASIVSAVIVSIFVEGAEIPWLLRTMIFGFEAENAEISRMINGGGLVSMLNAAAIVCLSSAYSGIFAATGLLDSLKEKTDALSKKITPYGATMVTSIFTSLISCNRRVFEVDCRFDGILFAAVAKLMGKNDCESLVAGNK